jgi:hypothetical protein
MSQGRRSRIVIDVARVQEEARRRKQRRFGRAGRLLSATALVVIAVVLVALLGGYLWWRSFERSPVYSLALLVDAAQRDDKQTVESMIDADQIAQGFIPQVIGKLTAPDSPVPPQARAALPSAIPQMLPRVSEGVRDEIEQDLKALSKGHTSFIMTALALRSQADVKEQSASANASPNTNNGNGQPHAADTREKAVVTVNAGDRPVELTMAREGERWKVVTVKDDKTASDIAARLASTVSASPQTLQPQPQPHHRSGR